jgi:predicted metal-dependent hydrolase
MINEIPMRLSNRAKRLSIVVQETGDWEVVVPAKRPVSDRVIRRFVHQHQDWIQEQQRKVARRPKREKLTHQGIPRTKVESQTRLLVHELIAEHCEYHPFEFKRIRIGSFKSQWGSCTHEGHLSFHYKLSLLPKELARYIVAHELAHTVHFNHSRAFWKFVREICQDADRCRKELKRIVP